MIKIYEDIFDARGSSYNEATAMCPLARARERDLLLQRLCLEPGHTLCDIPAGGGYVADGIDPDLYESIDMVCIEPSFTFTGGGKRKYRYVVGSFTDMPVADHSMDRVASLAGIHHLSDKQAFFNDVARILKPGGLFAVADVQIKTPPALFLNDAVHRMTETGHEGEFLAPGEMTRLLQTAGFTDVAEEMVEYNWDFPDEETMVAFCHDLFGMTKASLEQTREEIQRFLKVGRSNDGAYLEWSLVYATGQMPA